MNRIVYPVEVLGNLLHPSICVGNLGVLGCRLQINYYQMHDFVCIPSFLPKSVAITVANGLVSTAIHFSRVVMTMICVVYIVTRTSWF